MKDTNNTISDNENRFQGTNACSSFGDNFEFIQPHFPLIKANSMIQINPDQTPLGGSKQKEFSIASKGMKSSKKLIENKES